MTEGREPHATRANRQHLVGRRRVETLHRACGTLGDRRVEQQAFVALDRLSHGQRVVQRDGAGFSMPHELAEGGGVQACSDDYMSWLRPEIKPGTRNIHQWAAHICGPAGVMATVAFRGQDNLAQEGLVEDATVDGGRCAFGVLPEASRCADGVADIDKGAGTAISAWAGPLSDKDESRYVSQGRVSRDGRRQQPERREVGQPAPRHLGASHAGPG
ncbi:hypothetical protein D3C85_1196370 [compost metagenome]